MGKRIISVVALVALGATVFWYYKHQRSERSDIEKYDVIHL